MGAPVGRSVAPRQGKSDEFKALIELTTVGLFSTIAVTTNHGHWLKDAADVRPMTAPILRYIESLPKADLARLQKYLNPLLFAVGCASVVGPDIALELRIRKRENWEAQNRRSERAGLGSAERPTGRSVEQPGYQAQSGGNGAVSNTSSVVAPPEDLVGIVVE